MDALNDQNRPSPVETPSAAATPFPSVIRVLTHSLPSQAPECRVALCYFHRTLYILQRVMFDACSKIGAGRRSYRGALGSPPGGYGLH